MRLLMGEAKGERESGFFVVLISPIYCVTSGWTALVPLTDGQLPMLKAGEVQSVRNARSRECGAAPVIPPTARRPSHSFLFICFVVGGDYCICDSAALLHPGGDGDGRSWVSVDLHEGHAWCFVLERVVRGVRPRLNAMQLICTQRENVPRRRIGRCSSRSLSFPVVSNAVFGCVDVNVDVMTR